MKIDVLTLITERTKYAFVSNNQSDEFIDKAVAGSPERCCFVTTDGLFKKWWRRNHSFDDYYITAVFDLSTIYAPFTWLRVSLYVLSRKESKVIKTGIYKETLTSKRTGLSKSKDSFEPISPMPADYLEYCKLIDEWLNKGGDTPPDSENYEFNPVERNAFDNEKPFAKRYTKQVVNLLETLKIEATIPLRELAEIIVPKQILPYENGQTLHAKCLKYPFNEKELVPGVSTNTKVKKGDIIYTLNNRLYLVNCDLNNVYASQHMNIIRPKGDTSPEYLFVYLNSETSKIIRSALSVGNVVERIGKSDLSNFPIITQPNDVSEYEEIFDSIYSSGLKEIEIDKLANLISKLTGCNSSLEGSLLKEQLENVKKIKNPKVQEIISDDINELKTCYENGAYKATLILAGSILEAFLIDWISEIKGTNYYNSDYYVADRNDPTKLKRAELVDYINEISEIKKPGWMEEAEKAHAIRNNRNMVHAKLCMKKAKQINKSTCKEVINYLIDIISTRYRSLFNNN